MDEQELVLRSLQKNEDYDHITQLLHNAYKVWADRGMKYLASYQNSEKTIQRCAEGHTIVAEWRGKVAGVITINNPQNTGGCEYYERTGVTSFHQFAIDPTLQSQGLGSTLLGAAEAYAKRTGVSELALDTSEHAVELIEFYKRKGYSQVSEVKWPLANYKSVILSKKLL